MEISKYYSQVVTNNEVRASIKRKQGNLYQCKSHFLCRFLFITVGGQRIVVSVKNSLAGSKWP